MKRNATLFLVYCVLCFSITILGYESKGEVSTAHKTISWDEFKVIAKKLVKY